MSRVGEKIKAARETAGVSQKMLAKKLGVAEKFINEVEMGRKVVQESFIDRAAKILKVDLNDISMVVTDEALMEERKSESTIKPSKITAKTLGETSAIWTEAFSSVLKKVPIYDYKLNNILGGKELPIYSNRVEGYPSDKVFYLKIEDNDMAGFRIMTGDIVFGHLVKEVSSNGIFLIAYKSERKIRQVKSLGNSKVLLINNSGSVITETVDLNSIDIIAKLERVEIAL